MDDVAIIGVGLHPFGRFGAKSAIDMGADAVRAALRRRRRQWKDVQFAFGGSFEVDNPDAVDRPARPHRHPVHGRLQRLRHRGHGPAADRRRHPLGPVRHRRRRRHGQAPARRLHVRPRRLRRPALVRRDRALPHHQVLRHEDQPVHARPRHLARDPGQGGGQGLPQRRAEPERLPPQADLRGGDPRVADAQLPAHPVHVLRPRRGRGGRRAVPGRPRPPLHLDADLPAGHRAAHPPLRRLRGPQPRGPRSSRDAAPTVYASQAAYEQAGIGPEDVDVSSCRTPTPAPRSSTWPRTASAPTASRRS